MSNQRPANHRNKKRGDEKAKHKSLRSVRWIQKDFTKEKKTPGNKEEENQKTCTEKKKNL